MQLGMVGLGRMGAGMVRRLMKNGQDCVVYDTQPDAVAVRAQKVLSARTRWAVVEPVLNDHVPVLPYVAAAAMTEDRP